MYSLNILMSIYVTDRSSGIFLVYRIVMMKHLILYRAWNNSLTCDIFCALLVLTCTNPSLIWQMSSQNAILQYIFLLMTGHLGKCQNKFYLVLTSVWALYSPYFMLCDLCMTICIYISVCISNMHLIFDLSNTTRILFLMLYISHFNCHCIHYYIIQ